MKNNYYYKIQLPFTIDLNSFKSITDQVTNRLEYPGPIEVPRDLVDKNLIAYFLDKNIEITHTSMFYTPPNCKKVVHVDSIKFDNHCKINFIFGPCGYMRWWIPKNKNLIEKKYTNIGTDYLYIDEKDCDLVYEIKPSVSCIVNTGFFHSVENDENLERWCLSHKLYNKRKDKLLTIDDIDDVFSL